MERQAEKRHMLKTMLGIYPGRLSEETISFYFQFVKNYSPEEIYTVFFDLMKDRKDGHLRPRPLQLEERLKQLKRNSVKLFCIACSEPLTCSRALCDTCSEEFYAYQHALKMHAWGGDTYPIPVVNQKIVELATAGFSMKLNTQRK